MHWPKILEPMPKGDNRTGNIRFKFHPTIVLITTSWKSTQSAGFSCDVDSKNAHFALRLRLTPPGVMH
jgi:hypothetical protein